MARSLFALAAVLTLFGCLASSCQAERTPQQVVQTIQTMTQKSQALVKMANLSIANSALLLIDEEELGPRIIAGLDDLRDFAGEKLSGLRFPGDPPVSDIADATALSVAFREFASAQSALLKILIFDLEHGVFSPDHRRQMVTPLRDVGGVVGYLGAVLCNEDSEYMEKYPSVRDELWPVFAMLVADYEDAIKRFESNGLSGNMRKLTSIAKGGAVTGGRKMLVGEA